MAIDWRLVLSTGCALGLLAGCSDADSSSGKAADGGMPARAHHDDADGGQDDSEKGNAAKGDSSKGGQGGHGGSGGNAGSGGKDASKPDKPATGGTGAAAGMGGAGGSAGKGGAGGAAAQDSGAHFFLPTIEPTNTTRPTLLADANGGTHMLYPTYGSGGAFYAYCGDGCANADDVKPVLLTTDGTVGNAALALTKEGKPRALLSTLLRVYYAQCDSACTESDSWTVTPIVEHNGDQDVTGQALALDPNGKPRFILHTYLAYLGVGQKAPKTWYATCESDCNSASSWEQHEIDDLKIWYGSELQIDGMGHAHVLTGIENADDMSAGIKLAAYVECDSGCTSKDAWNGIALSPLYESSVEEMHPSLSLQLTSKNQPRVLFLERGGPNNRRLLYFECDDQCTGDHWTGTALSDLKELGDGVDLILDSKDRPRFVFTLDDNIGFYRCDSASCAGEDAAWQLTKVEFAGEVPKDNIILWPNCTIDAWILHRPSLALGRDGSVRVGYQATDLSGGFSMPEPTQTGCVAGKDMTLSRMTLLAEGAIQ